MQTRPVTEIVSELQAALNHSSSDAIKMRIEAKIEEEIKDFNEGLEDYHVNSCSLDEFDLEEYEDFTAVENKGAGVATHILRKVIESDPYVIEDFDSLESVVREINDVERHFFPTRRKIKELQSLLKNNN